VYFPKVKQIAEYMHDVQLQIKKKGGEMKIAKSDNGGEFVNTQLEQHFLNSGVEHECTSPHSSHQNGIAERTNRFICELSIALIIDAGVPLYLWPYAVAYVVYISNRMPNKALNLHSTAYVAIHGHIPDVSRLRTFGCTAYMHLPDNEQSTFGPRAVKGIFVGVVENSLAYLIYVPAKRRVYMSGHVTFNEDLSSRRELTIQEQEDFDRMMNEMDQDANETSTIVNPLIDIDTPTITHSTPSARQVITTSLKSNIHSIQPTLRTTIQSTTNATSTSLGSPQHQQQHNSPSDTGSIQHRSVERSSMPSPVASAETPGDATTTHSPTSRTSAIVRLITTGGGRKRQQSTIDDDNQDKYDIIKSRIRKPTTTYNASALFSGVYYNNRYETYVNQSIDDIEMAFIAEDVPEGGPDNMNSPSTEEAMRGQHKQQWLQSMKEELLNLGNIPTWEIVNRTDIPRQHKPLKHKWVHKLKYEKGIPTRFRSRLTVKGCGQKQGIDFHETFSPVAKITTVRLLLALGVVENFHFWQLDVYNAFPNADLEEEIYMEAPKEMELDRSKVLKLLKALYGLTQASRQWHKHARKVLTEELGW
jgi:hypothetical protein